MRLLAPPAITLMLLAIAPQAAAQSTPVSTEGKASQLMNAAFDLGSPADNLRPNATNLKLPVSLNLRNTSYDLRLMPHAALGVNEAGRSAEAGAMLTFGLGRPDKSLTGTLDRLGIADGSASNSSGRWYMFAAASGRALRLNTSQGWDRAWSQDRSSALVGDAQLGLGWRRGDLQTSLGLIHRTVKGDHMLWGQETKDDSVLAFSFSVRPQR